MSIQRVTELADLVIRSVDSHASTDLCHSELDILEMVAVTNTVITERLLTSHHVKYSTGNKRKHAKLFDSIHKQTQESIRTAFAGTASARGPILYKYNTLVLDEWFKVLNEVGLHRAKDVSDAIVSDIITNTNDLAEVDYTDAHKAAAMLDTLSKLRAHKQQYTSRKQKLSNI